MVEEERTIDDIFEEHGIDKGDMEAAVELGRLVADDTGICCEELGRLIWDTYQRLQEKGGEE